MYVMVFMFVSCSTYIILGQWIQNKEHRSHYVLNFTALIGLIFLVLYNFKYIHDLHIFMKRVNANWRLIDYISHFLITLLVTHT